MKIQFEEVTLHGTKQVRTKAGRLKTVKKKFFQTVNPFNKNARGQVKSREEIMRELEIEREAWLRYGEDV